MGFGDDKTSKIVPQRVELLAHEVIVQVLLKKSHFYEFASVP